MIAKFLLRKLWNYLAKLVNQLAHLPSFFSKGIFPHSGDFLKCYKLQTKFAPTVYFLIHICVYTNKLDFCHNGLSFVSVNICTRREICTSSLHTRAYKCSYIYLYIFMFMLLIVIVMVIVTLSTFVSCLNWPNARCNFARILFVSDESSSGYIYIYIWHICLYLCGMYLYLWNETHCLIAGAIAFS